MAQKTGTISLRLGYKAVWNSLWSEDRKTYKHLVFRDFEINKYIKVLTKYFGISAEKVLCKVQNGTIVINSKRLAKTFLKDELHTNFRNSRSFKSVSFPLNFDWVIQNQLENFSRSKKLKRTVNLWESKLLFRYIPARFFSSLISHQLKLPTKRRSFSFRAFGIQGGIQSILRFYFNSRTKMYISGIRVVCKGKWSKTNTGRSQKLTISMGKLNNQVLDTFIDSHTSIASTKFGAFSVNVLISYKQIVDRI